MERCHPVPHLLPSLPWGLAHRVQEPCTTAFTRFISSSPTLFGHLVNLFRHTLLISVHPTGRDVSTEDLSRGVCVQTYPSPTARSSRERRAGHWLAEDKGPRLSFALFLTAGFPGEDRSQRDTPEEGAVTVLPSFPALSRCLWGLLGRVLLRNGWRLKSHNDNTALREGQPMARPAVFLRTILGLITHEETKTQASP